MQPFVLNAVSAGFPSPGDDYCESCLSLDEYLIKHKAATFFIRAQGDSMTGAGITSGDVLIVDRALEVQHKDIIIAYLNGEFMVKYFIRKHGKVGLFSANKVYKPYFLHGGDDFEVWGVVTTIIKKLK